MENDARARLEAFKDFKVKHPIWTTRLSARNLWEPCARFWNGCRSRSMCRACSLIGAGLASGVWGASGSWGTGWIPIDDGPWGK